MRSDQCFIITKLFIVLFFGWASIQKSFTYEFKKINIIGFKTLHFFTINMNIDTIIFWVIFWSTANIFANKFQFFFFFILHWVENIVTLIDKWDNWESGQWKNKRSNHSWQKFMIEECCPKRRGKKRSG